MEVIKFHVEGTPCTRSKKKLAIGYKNGRPYPYEYVQASSNETQWKRQVTIATRSAMQGRSFKGQVEIEVLYIFDRPQSHFKPDGSIKNAAPECHFVKPDIDNLNKVLLDGITSKDILKEDIKKILNNVDVLPFETGDQQFNQVNASKQYGNQTFQGAIITMKGTIA